MIVFLLLLILIIPLIEGLFGYPLVIELDLPDFTKSPKSPKMHWAKLEDGNNHDAERGCFFVLKADGDLNWDPTEYTFWVREKNGTPIKLDFGFREYNYNGTPFGGDRNASYRYDGETVEMGKRWEDMPPEKKGLLWRDGECIAFDMPKKMKGIDIAEEKVYEVSIRNPKNDFVFLGTFVYYEGNIGEMENRSYEDCIFNL